MSIDPNNSDVTVGKKTSFYGWVIVAACTILLATQGGIIYSFSVFFKPMAADFGWSRAAISGVYAAFMISRSVFAVPVGRLADRFGPARATAMCGFITGLGLVLTSKVNTLWQFYLVYSLIVGIGLSGVFAIATSTTTRWFVKRRGLALGIVSAGVGIGILTMLPVAEHLIFTFAWSKAYFIIGIVAWVLMITSALFLRRNSEEMGCHVYGVEAPQRESNADHKQRTNDIAPEDGITLRDAAHTRPFWMLFSIYFLFIFCVQMIMLHLVNYTTDLGITSRVAATLISVVGAANIVGRLVMGTLSDRIGNINAVFICCIILMTSLLWLIFAKELWMFYLFAIVFGFAFGGLVPQMPALMGKFFGLRAETELVGAIYAGSLIGGALGSWMAGQIFDATQSYQVAFIIAVIASLFNVIIALMLKKVKIATPDYS